LRRDPLLKSTAAFARTKGSGIIVVAFDIPEKERRKRDWIRMCLVEMSFEMLQKSVWAAKGAIDENFIHALRDRNLLDKVHIFTVTQQGTISLGAGE